MMDELRALISEFQTQTRSNDILLFLVWLENRIKLIEKIGKSKPEAIAQKIVDEITKPKPEAKK